MQVLLEARWVCCKLGACIPYSDCWYGCVCVACESSKSINLRSSNQSRCTHAALGFCFRLSIWVLKTSLQPVLPRSMWLCPSTVPENSIGFARQKPTMRSSNAGSLCKPTRQAVHCGQVNEAMWLCDYSAAGPLQLHLEPVSERVQHLRHMSAFPLQKPHHPGQFAQSHKRSNAV